MADAASLQLSEWRQSGCDESNGEMNWSVLFERNNETFQSAFKAAELILNEGRFVANEEILSPIASPIRAELLESDAKPCDSSLAKELNALQCCYTGRESILQWNQSRGNLFWLYEVTDLLLRRKAQMATYRPGKRIYETNIIARARDLESK